MILTYHNIGQNNNQTWVSLASFQRQMNELKENGYRVVEFEEYDPFDDKQIVLTFDDGRKNILDVVPLLKKNKFPFYVFVVGKFIGYSPEFLAESDFEIIRKGGGKLGWHTQTHQDLTKLSKAKIVKELKNPYGFAYLSYPCWKNNATVAQIAKKLGYKYARSGDGHAHKALENYSLDSVFMQEFTPVKYINDKIVKYMDMALYSYPCNLRCHYCYIGQYASEKERAKITPMKYSPADLEKALNKKRMGGTCVVTFSATGETLLLSSTMPYLKAILQAGHFLHISTNLTITKHIDELLALPEEMRSRLFFKASLQYLELKRLKLQDVFVQNCHKIWDAGVTCAVEITPSDELIPYIPEIKAWSLKNFGALPQLSIPRDETVPQIKLLSKFSLREFARNWEDFYSEEFRFKVKMWERPVKDFCYAGKFSFFITVNDGKMYTCPKSKMIGNFYKGENLYTEAAAKCPQKHCFVCHNWCGFGSCPAIDETNYLLERDRIMPDGRHWVAERCRHAFRQRVCDNNEHYSLAMEKKLYKKAAREQLIYVWKMYAKSWVYGALSHITSGKLKEKYARKYEKWKIKRTINQ